MFKIKIVKLLFMPVIVIAILNLSGFSFADDDCSDNASTAGLPTIPSNYKKTENWDSSLKFDPSNSQKIGRNSSVTLKIIGGTPPYSWSVEGNGLSLSENLTWVLSNVLTAGSSACGSAIIKVTDIFQSYAEGSIRVTNYGDWYLVSDEQCSNWQRDRCAFCTVEDTFTIGGYRYQNIWIGDKACNMTTKTCEPYPGGVDLRGDACSVVGYHTPAYANTFYQRKKWEWRCSP